MKNCVPKTFLTQNRKTYIAKKHSFWKWTKQEKVLDVHTCNVKYEMNIHIWHSFFLLKMALHFKVKNT